MFNIYKGKSLPLAVLHIADLPNLISNIPL